MLFVVLALLLSSLYFYVQAFKSGLCQKKWAIAGLVFGPILLPMFSIKKQVHFRKSVGFGAVLLRA
ncbi:hypothetical protein [Flocculibacter collagenilyticus]|uniref:hypothetical protein n=1 Tax=Flocculibacter collagenilyticus TaxID=2744479 RepID=UPI0018F412DE|nr:hypothetical protein [Flocculibacter collagenilyticus]